MLNRLHSPAIEMGYPDSSNPQKVLSIALTAKFRKKKSFNLINGQLFVV